MTADPMDRFEPLLARDGVTKGKIFGMPSLLINGNAALSATDSGIIYRLDEGGIVEASKIEGAGHFVPFGKGPPMKAWIEVPLKADADWLGLAELSLAFAGAMPPKKAKAKKKP
ncbi:MAG: hypothetical protein AAF414_02960 [Pseudomonadota bacterium]